MFVPNLMMLKIVPNFACSLAGSQRSKSAKNTTLLEPVGPGYYREKAPDICLNVTHFVTDFIAGMMNHSICSSISYHQKYFEKSLPRFEQIPTSLFSGVKTHGIPLLQVAVKFIISDPRLFFCFPRKGATEESGGKCHISCFRRFCGHA